MTADDHAPQKNSNRRFRLGLAAREGALSFLAELGGSTDDPSDGEGLRERKKRRLRKHISDVATRLFLERGFDDVTLSEIADAADVSVKTILNHFGAKEDLFFDQREPMLAALRRTIIERPSGSTAVAAVGAALTDDALPFMGVPWQALRHRAVLGGISAFHRVAADSATLRARGLAINREGEHELRSILSDALSLADDDAVVFAALLWTLIRLRGDTFADAIRAGRTADEIETLVRDRTGDALARVARATADLDRPAT